MTGRATPSGWSCPVIIADGVQEPAWKELMSGNRESMINSFMTGASREEG
jgi:hypothetical protein